MNDKGKPELIAGQIIPFDQINKSKYDRVSDSRGTFYIPKDPTSGLKTLKDIGGGKYTESVYQKPKSGFIATKNQLEPIALGIQGKYDLSPSQSYIVSNKVLSIAQAWKKKNPDSPVTINDKATSLVTELYVVNDPEWWLKFMDSSAEIKPQFAIGSVIEDSKGNRARITGYNPDTQQPVYEIIKGTN